MRWFRAMRMVFALACFALLAVHSFAQSEDDPNQAPLGDVARSLRKKNAPAQPVIDDDNLTIVMQQAEKHRSADSAWKFLMGAGDKGFQVSQPDVSCSLSFTANARSLLTRQYAQMDLPADEMQKLEGPATIDGDALTVSVFNGTDWHVSEVQVALTFVRKAGLGSLSFDPASFVSNTDNGQGTEIRSQRNPDVTVIYRMRAAAAPLATAVFSAPLNEELAPGEEWHWAIVQARGYPPESYAAAIPSSAQTNPSITSTRIPVPGSTITQSQSAVSPSQVPQ